MATKFIALSGTTGVTENLYVYESGNDVIVVDCGVGFPESEMLGVDLVIPDFTYLIENKARLKGIFITHGHEDHIGALPFLLKEVQAPIHATKLVAGFIADKFTEYGIENLDLRVFDPEKDTVSAGVFRITPFRISHSVPDAVGFAIDTPDGRIFHVADYKFDWTPVDGRPFDIRKAALLAAGDRPLALASDCLGSTSPGNTESEKEIQDRIETIVRDAKGKVYFTTISSNISRMQQALNVAQMLGRKVIFVGRSIDSKAEIARRLGYLHYPNNLVINPKQAEKMPNSKLMYVISGSYGQPGSALYRTAVGEHQYLSIEKGDTVIFSSDPAPPGSKDNVDYVVDKLIEIGVDVHYYDLQEDLHVSGHGSQKDIELLTSIIHPRYFIPIGGTIRHMRAYSVLLQGMGYSQSDIFELRPGDVVTFANETARITERIPVREVLVDGLGIGDVGTTILRDRQVLSQHGVVIVLIELEKEKAKVLNPPELISRGFVFGSSKKDLFRIASQELTGRIEKQSTTDRRAIKTVVTDYLEKFFFDETGRRPMVLPVVVEV